ncbi:MAG: lipoprotein [Muribaculaceae bacterium]|nr:lipoprotein [Muribaculaceae bacterium]
MKKHLFFAAVALIGLTACSSEVDIFDSEKETANEKESIA